MVDAYKTKKSIKFTKGKKRKKKSQPLPAKQPTFKVKELTSPAKANPDSALAIIDKMRGMSWDQLMRIWQNAVRKSTHSDKTWRKRSKTIIKAVNREWGRRATRPLDPNDFFAWPTTAAEGGDGRLSLQGAPREGLLAYLEYRVGRTNGLHSNVRRAILCEVFERHLPPVFPAEYLGQWGQPNTAARLKKMAETLAAFVRNAKRRDSISLDDAIRDWENDLEFLYHRYYVGKFRFAWPIATV